LLLIAFDWALMVLFLVFLFGLAQRRVICGVFSVAKDRIQGVVKRLADVVGGSFE
jgi:hypothetical protein